MTEERGDDEMGHYRDREAWFVALLLLGLLDIHKSDRQRRRRLMLVDQLLGHEMSGYGVSFLGELSM